MPHRSDFWNFLLGRFTLDSLPFLHNTPEGRIILITMIVVGVIGVAILGAITKAKK